MGVIYTDVLIVGAGPAGLAAAALLGRYNLACKLALVLSGKAGGKLLDTYHAERSPVGRQVVDRANKSIAEMLPFSQALGLRPGQSKEAAWANPDELYGDSEARARRREELSPGST
jgi:2,4-dichlorophenol 6-monooxygenase